MLDSINENFFQKFVIFIRAKKKKKKAVIIFACNFSCVNAKNKTETTFGIINLITKVSR
jgi:hypothetical protein